MGVFLNLIHQLKPMFSFSELRLCLVSLLIAIVEAIGFLDNDVLTTAIQ